MTNFTIKVSPCGFLRVGFSIKVSWASIANGVNNILSIGRYSLAGDKELASILYKVSCMTAEHL